ncbi:MAG TPA: histidine kinase [Chitinophagaceae bacterium]
MEGGAYPYAQKALYWFQTTCLIKVNDTGLRVLLAALPVTIFLYDFLMAPGGTGAANLVYIATTLLVCEGSRWLIYRSRSWFRPPHQRGKRMSALLPAGVGWVAIVLIASKTARNYFAFGTTASIISGGSTFTLHVNDFVVQPGLVGSSIINGVLIFGVMLGLYELAWHFARLRRAEQQRDRLEKEKLQAELQQLKGIVNPHFLFNNLNSLSALIAESPAQAEAFLDELTKVFRYLLRNNETDLTTLAQELQFLDSYFHLLQTRYGAAISMDVRVDPVSASYLLPPMTLQLLVENAVKHNRLQKDDPLRIEVFGDDRGRLVVRNNLSVRPQASESTGIGLRNIRSRYALLHQEAPEVRKDERTFSVIIPLIPAGEVTLVEKPQAASYKL